MDGYIGGCWAHSGFVGSSLVTSVCYALLISWATVNQAHHEGWMVSGQETVFCWVPVVQITMGVSSVLSFHYLPTNKPLMGCW